MDADVLFHKFAYHHEYTNEWNPDEPPLIDTESAITQMDDFVAYSLHVTETKSVILCVSDSVNFRYDVMPTYKYNRRNLEAPVLHGILKDYALNHPRYPAYRYPNLEADDVMGIVSTKSPNRYVIATVDKDLRQIPGAHYNWMSDKWVRTVDPIEADSWFYQQILSGDSADGYIGCPMIGHEKAADIVASVPKQGTQWWHREMWRLIVEVYKAVDAVFAYESYLVDELDESHALLTARVARILRHSEYNIKEKSVNLWNPKS